jgi:hypothetical protein
MVTQERLNEISRLKGLYRQLNEFYRANTPDDYEQTRSGQVISQILWEAQGAASARKKIGLSASEEDITNTLEIYNNVVDAWSVIKASVTQQLISLLSILQGVYKHYRNQGHSDLITPLESGIADLVEKVAYLKSASKENFFSELPSTSQDLANIMRDLYLNLNSLLPPEKEIEAEDSDNLENDPAEDNLPNVISFSALAQVVVKLLPANFTPEDEQRTEVIAKVAEVKISPDLEEATQKIEQLRQLYLSHTKDLSESLSAPSGEGFEKLIIEKLWQLIQSPEEIQAAIVEDSRVYDDEAETAYALFVKKYEFNAALDIITAHLASQKIETPEAQVVVQPVIEDTTTQQSLALINIFLDQTLKPQIKENLENFSYALKLGAEINKLAGLLRDPQFQKALERSPDLRKGIKNILGDYKKIGEKFANKAPEFIYLQLVQFKRFAADPISYQLEYNFNPPLKVKTLKAIFDLATRGDKSIIAELLKQPNINSIVSKSKILQKYLPSENGLRSLASGALNIAAAFRPSPIRQRMLEFVVNPSMTLPTATAISVYEGAFYRAKADFINIHVENFNTIITTLAKTLGNTFNINTGKHTVAELLMGLAEWQVQHPHDEIKQIAVLNQVMKMVFENLQLKISSHPNLFDPIHKNIGQMRAELLVCLQQWNELYQWCQSPELQGKVDTSSFTQLFKPGTKLAGLAGNELAAALLPTHADALHGAEFSQSGKSCGLEAAEFQESAVLHTSVGSMHM